MQVTLLWEDAQARRRQDFEAVERGVKESMRLEFGTYVYAYVTLNINPVRTNDKRAHVNMYVYMHALGYIVHVNYSCYAMIVESLHMRLQAEDAAVNISITGEATADQISALHLNDSSLGGGSVNSSFDIQNRS
jgi:hypothetical protein